ncbi:hypothetical protein EG328_009570 [Venturia inaequalis]|uniref:Uncharacterized protein n=1 Tax=Venturia inaequalis TaxID=5025 RepID=A0A8H3U9E4_VENIN|nr:hypothetical protein EG328_009570 [Venturia inaequalis]
MRASTFTSAVLVVGAKLVAGLDSSSLTQFKDSLTLDSTFNPVIEAYWTGYPHHRRTPFAISPDGASAYLAYLDASGTGVHVQKLKPDTFVADGTAVTITGGKEAGGLVAHNDGFALLTNEALPSGTSNAPAGSTPVPVIYRYTGGAQTWKTFVAGPSVAGTMGLLASPDMNGDLVYSEAAKLYGAYFVATAYSGDANGHFGDAIQYVSDAGELQKIDGASSTWGCSHNTGILFEAADAAPFASVCAEDQGDIWLNTATQSMSGVKVSNENTTNGASGEPFGGMSGSYSGLARFQGASSYIMAWVSNGAVDLTANTWLGDGNTACSRRNKNRNVAIATFSDKNTLVGEQATSVVGAADGDKQINWITTGTSDMSNARIATFDKSSALVSWEEASSPNCDSFVAMGCYGTYAGTSFQVVDSTGAKSGTVLTTKDVQVAGDMVTMSDGRICWPYVSMSWSLAQMATTSATTKAISFACISNGPSTGAATSSSSSSIASSVAPSSVAVSDSPVARSPSTPASSAAPTTPAAAEAASSPAASSSIAPTPLPSTKAALTSAIPPKLTSSESQFPTLAGTGSGIWPTGSFPSGTGYAASGVFPSGFISPTGTSDEYGYEYECDEETTSASASVPTVPVETHAPSKDIASSTLPSSFSFPTSGWAVPSSASPYPTAASSGFGGVGSVVTASTASSSKSKHHGNTRKHSKTSKTKTPKSRTAGVAQPTGYVVKRSEHHDHPHGTGFSSSALPTGSAHLSDFDWNGTAEIPEFKHHSNTRKHSAHGTGVLPTGSIPTGSFSHPTSDVVSRAAETKKHFGNARKHSSAFPTGLFPTGSSATGSYSTGSFATGTSPSSSFPTGTTSAGGAKNRIAIGLELVTKPKTKKNDKRAAEPSKHHGNTRKHSSAFPTGIFPTGSLPTGASPTGASPTGVFPTGSFPTGTTSAGGAKNKIAIGLALGVTKPKTKKNDKRVAEPTKHHGNTRKHSPEFPAPTGSLPTGFASPTGVKNKRAIGLPFIVEPKTKKNDKRAAEPTKHHGNTRKHSSAFPNPTGVFPTGSFPTGSLPTGFASPTEAKSKRAIGLPFIVEPKTKKNDKRIAEPTKHHATGIAHGTGTPQPFTGTDGFPAFPTGGVAYPTGFETRFAKKKESPKTHRGHGNHPHGTGYHGKPKGTGGVFPTGVFPTGVFPTGVFPNGAFPTGAFPTGVWPTDAPAAPSK